MERDRLLSHPEFARSPAMSKLLIFLAENRLSDATFRLTAHIVAVDGMGRDANFDTEINSYPRVQISRLRKMLDNFYIREGGENRLKIPVGNYELLLVPNTVVPKRFTPQNPIIQNKSGQAAILEAPLPDRPTLSAYKSVKEFSLSLNAVILLSGIVILSLTANVYWALLYKLG